MSKITVPTNGHAELVEGTRRIRELGITRLDWGEAEEAEGGAAA